MHIHILGICGTFMAGLAVLAKQLGHTVVGSDAAVYPPMSTQLAAQGIECKQGYLAEHLTPRPDCVIIGNALSRGNPAVEAVLNQGIPYISGAQWLAEEVLQARWVVAIAGTHGKTTTSSMVAWILADAGLACGFLIGGLPENFGVSARLGDVPFFVVEADEYDTAFFDKRAKFVHYCPHTLILNNLEFDHADIYPDLASIQRQFHHLVRTVPNNGLIIYNGQEASLNQVLQQGCWTPTDSFNHVNAEWQAKLLTIDGSAFEVYHRGKRQGVVNWELCGEHNVNNALAAIIASRHVGIIPQQACESLSYFKSVKRRLELRGTVNQISVYDDFAHHPTAIRVTLDALRKRVGTARIIAVLEPRSNTMKMGCFQDELAPALQQADIVLFYQSPQLGWSLAKMVSALPHADLFGDTEAIVQQLSLIGRPNDHIIIMSNGGFDNVHQRLLDALKEKI
ncbi:UDP-N-acetylmuramate:L-alanyl-gamma-D-glutamyl-meso-diaminopimelate ligase [Beggiatoa leptomitoformis]|uniref:UDP-N-acetylmuramate--L-alanyl-gamma-D-glutamyl-meso-2,6-diaminoheptandioate ligase n=1 Tax=Beggiatoa leptomitoformis TaxID=288004 RepID=A0A2N9YG86_9GAMM|nr:UDP-N-acetylmuramate:L-alanyl-gamma-D-glutamyl-meso-diaminopimelate ligase [Beggiatoa leptomitoformis]ALG68164.1 UDP-N-acetylmuramate:L-alanyl-gamma-D-glutamyl-meso-diaminopimelate ligase [Beggiatoa leptomitoformis]AUI69538.1 UDP-N-acetylmuramate:L-alanyl-gamma-D-glutamyl-meso-diaminopimelate ligase [Beggiatoa leptomitoformis]